MTVLRRMAAVVLLEVAQVRGLWLLALRRTHRESPGDVTLPYAAGRGSIYLMIVAVCLVELIAVHLMVPWHRLGTWAWLQWLMFALSAYGVLWILAWWAAQRTHPHLLTGDELVLRSAARVVLRVPLSAISVATPRRRGYGTEGRLMLGGLGGGTNLDVELVSPVSGSGRRAQEYAAISLEVDDAAVGAREITAAAGRRVSRR